MAQNDSGEKGGSAAMKSEHSPFSPLNEYNISINYELGMHCTGFDFSYCCVLPPYNSIQSQVIKTPSSKKRWPELLEAAEDDHSVLEDGKNRYKLAYGHLDNTYSEGNKLKYWNVPYDVNGDGKYGPNENVANAYFTHLYVYKDLKGTNPKGTSKDSEKLRVGLEIPVPKDNGPAGAAAPSPMNGGFLHYTGEEGTIVYTKSPVLDNVPIVLTNPGIWDALGLPLTPFNDRKSKDLLSIVESDIQPYQQAWVRMVDAKSGEPVIDGKSGKPVSFVGTNPIDIPNCANCHSNETANGKKYKLYKTERAFWKGLGASDWIANLKATSLSILEMHDDRHGTDFTKNYQGSSRDTANRLGHDPVLCQKCHADNVIGVLNSKTHKGKDGKDHVIPPLTQAIHTVHQTNVPMPDEHGRTASCQGCHPAHRQDGNMDGYPITADGKNAYANGDNRDAKGGCYVGRDVHSNPAKDKDGVGTPEHLNAVGEWLKTNVSQIGTGDGGKGLWCTNCHNQLSRELYQRDNLENAFKQTGETLRNKSLDEIAKAIGVSKKELEEKYMDPKVVPDAKGHDTPGKSGILLTWARERLVPDIAVIALKGNGPLVTKDEDGDINVKILSANPAVDPKSLKLPEGATGALAVPYEAATHGRDYWISPGAPHCADCHAAPFVEGQGGVAFPINQPGKYSLMRYTKGHAGLACQTCHESIHGLYPVTSDTDWTTYKQPTQYNPNGSHGPLTCAACHFTNDKGVPLVANKKEHVWKGKSILEDFDSAVQWMHASAPDLGGKIPE
ncbi:cytochrome c3 family protein [Endothiovibrio diazotrophicus]